MKHRRTLLAALGLAAATSLGTLPAFSQSDTQAPPADRETAHRAHFEARIDAKLQRMADRLQLDASQQAAWAAYAQTVRAVFAGPRPKPPAGADAATLLRFRSERAVEHAQKLAQLADATATLQQALNEEQRRTLDQMVRHARHGKFRHGHGRRHERG